MKTRAHEYRDLLERWLAWWDGPGQKGFNGMVVPPLTVTLETLSCQICQGLVEEGRCEACGRDLELAG